VPHTLHLAAFFGRAGAAAALLEAGADPGLLDGQQRIRADVLDTDWTITQYVIQLLGLQLGREEVEAGRAAIRKRLEE
jgi:hypothetical protein